MAEIGIPLCDLVDAVRAEMEQAARQARGKQLQFEVQDLQLEVEIATTRIKEGEAGLRIVVVTAGAKASKADITTHKVTLKLVPVTASGTKFKVSDIVDQPVPST